jgi:hypothetical protein
MPVFVLRVFILELNLINQIVEYNNTASLMSYQ